MDSQNARRACAWVTLIAMVSLLAVGLCVAFGEQSDEVRYAELASNKKATFSKSGTVIDYGNSENGYVMLKQEAGKKRYKLKVSKGDDSYMYDVNQQGEYEIIPLQMGSGKYKFQMYKQKKGTEYTPLSNTTIKADLKEKDINYLYPNQYVNYNADTQAVAKSFELCEGLTTDEDKVKAIFGFVSKNIIYDYPLAMTVKSGYLPDIDQVLRDGKGICFGYSALMACMLRVQGIPTQLVIGHADKTYHAWNKILIGGEWQRYDATFESTGGTAKKYTEERRY